MFGGPYGVLVLVSGLLFMAVVAGGIFNLYRRKTESADSPIEQWDDPFAAALAEQGWLDAMEGQSLLR